MFWTGLDPAGWMAAGLVDVLVAQPIHIPNANYGPSIGDAHMDPNYDCEPLPRTALLLLLPWHHPSVV